MIVILEFCKWEQVIPVILPLICEKAEILLKFLVDPFCLSISLWVICCGSCQFYSEDPVEFFSEICYKLGASVQHYFLRKSMMFPDVLQVKLGSPGG